MSVSGRKADTRRDRDQMDSAHVQQRSQQPESVRQALSNERIFGYVLVFTINLDRRKPPIGGTRTRSFGAAHIRRFARVAASGSERMPTNCQ